MPVPAGERMQVTVDSLGMLFAAYRSPVTLACLVVFLTAAFTFFRVSVGIPKPFDVAALKKRKAGTTRSTKTTRAGMSPIFWQIAIATCVLALSQVREIATELYPHARSFRSEFKMWNIAAQVVFPQALANAVVYAHTGHTSALPGFVSAGLACMSAYASVQAGFIPAPGQAAAEMPGRAMLIQIGTLLPPLAYFLILAIGMVRFFSASGCGHGTSREVKAMRDTASRLISGVAFLVLNNFMVDATVDACNVYLAPHITTIIEVVAGGPHAVYEGWTGPFFTEGMVRAFGLACALMLWGDSIVELARVSQGFHIVSGAPLDLIPVEKEEEEKKVVGKKKTKKTKKKSE